MRPYGGHASLILTLENLVLSGRGKYRGVVGVLCLNVSDIIARLTDLLASVWHQERSYERELERLDKRSDELFKLVRLDGRGDDNVKMTNDIFRCLIAHSLIE